MEVNIFQVDAFTNIPFGGNPAGVVTNSKGLKDDDMQRIANEMSLSETVFIRQLEDCYFKVRYFTPLCEVDLCGHATIAGIYTLAKKGYIKAIEKGTKKARIETRLGPLTVDIAFSGYEPQYIVMEQDTPRAIGRVEEINELAAAMGINVEEIGIDGTSAAPEIVSTGLPDIIMPVRNEEVLKSINVDNQALTALSNRLGVTGVHAFALDKDLEDEAVARNFAPAVGIPEEAATGTSNGALIYYLKSNNILKGERLLVRQGQYMNRPSQIACFINQGESGFKVKVGGSASIVLEGIMKF